jgi:hypothetical protein
MKDAAIKLTARTYCDAFTGRIYPTGQTNLAWFQAPTGVAETIYLPAA